MTSKMGLLDTLMRGECKAPMFEPKPLKTIEGLMGLPLKYFIDETCYYVDYVQFLDTRKQRYGVIFGKEERRMYTDMYELKKNVINYIKTQI